MHRRVRRIAILLAPVYTYGKSSLAGVFVFLLVLLLVVLSVVAVVLWRERCTFGGVCDGAEPRGGTPLPVRESAV